MMTDFEKLEKRMLENRKDFCEFLACYINRGPCELSCGFMDDNNFWFGRISDALGINELYICFNDIAYLNKIMGSREGLKTVLVITPLRDWTSGFADNWAVSTRRQFCKSTLSCAEEPKGFVQPDASHADLFAKSASDLVKTYYNMSLEYGDDVFAIIDGVLKCFVLVGKTAKTMQAEIQWIFTEPDFRNKGHASELLKIISDRFISDGYLMTYHCSGDNLASANTALKSGYTEVISEIELVRKQN